MNTDDFKGLAEALKDDDVLGLIGVGTFGSQIREYAEQRGIKVLLCDPPRSLEDVDELNDTFQLQWGNGMGGCGLSNAGYDTFLPLEHLARYATVISIQVPLTEEGAFPTRNMITRKFLSTCQPDIKLFCYSSNDVLAAETRESAAIHQER